MATDEPSYKHAQNGNDMFPAQVTSLEKTRGIAESIIYVHSLSCEALTAALGPSPRLLIVSRPLLDTVT
jgi:hypothetical protein